MAGTLVKPNLGPGLFEAGFPANIYMFCSGELANHSTCVLNFAGNTCPHGQVKIF